MASSSSNSSSSSSLSSSSSTYRFWVDVGTAELPFTLTADAKLIVESIAVEFFTVVKKDLYLNAIGETGADLHTYGPDAGQVPPPASQPTPLDDFPPGIEEVYRP